MKTYLCIHSAVWSKASLKSNPSGWQMATRAGEKISANKDQRKQRSFLSKEKGHPIIQLGWVSESDSPGKLLDCCRFTQIYCIQRRTIILKVINTVSHINMKTYSTNPLQNNHTWLRFELMWTFDAVWIWKHSVLPFSWVTVVIQW